MFARANLYYPTPRLRSYFSAIFAAHLPVYIQTDVREALDGWRHNNTYFRCQAELFSKSQHLCHFWSFMSNISPVKNHTFYEFSCVFFQQGQSYQSADIKSS